MVPFSATSIIDINECLRDNGRCDPDAACINTIGSFECTCDAGFDGDGFICMDIDECSHNPTLCENGQCLNYRGNYRCECDMGFEPEDSEGICIDVDECALFHNNCDFGKCENVFGMFRCMCNTGYQLDATGGNCTDINECDNPQICHYGTCINTPGSFVCECPPNYSLAPNGAGCIDIREGQCYLEVTGDHQGQGICSTELGERATKSTCCCSIGRGWGPICEVCPAINSTEFWILCPLGNGFRPNQITVVLEDIDECQDLTAICKGGRCSNTLGSFMCICPDGFVLDSTNRNCIDKDECALNIHKCGSGTCINTAGGYTCICPPQYVFVSSSTCVDMRRSNCFRQAFTTVADPLRLVCEHPMVTNETKVMCCCSIGRAWGEPCEACPPISSKQYSELCSMSPGTYVDPMTGETGDMDECKTGVCENGRCTNTIGSFVCECYGGYRFNRLINKCEDINECIETPDVCQGSSACTNSLGSFECRCPDGYKLSPDKRHCLDVNECSKTGMCNQGVCKNLDGSFVCTCNNGYYLSPDGKHCIDIDECKRSPGICSDGTCANVVGSYKCTCNPGFHLSPNGDCFDVDECRVQYGICQNGRCRNTIGSYACQCQIGYNPSLDGRNCVDINECLQDTCEHGSCLNSEGSFQCTCDKGYELSSTGRKCEDIDECQTVSFICEGGACYNNAGGFICTCSEGFVLSSDGKSCSDTREDSCFQRYEEDMCKNPKPFNLTKKECCCMKGSVAWGSSKSCDKCPDSRGEEFKNLCPDGFGYVKVDGVMEDINECMMDPTLCENGICINMDGNYRCECQNGFKLDPSGFECIDLDECRERPSICGNGTCLNVNGGFECDCREGFASGPQQICEDIDECEDMSSMCAFRCQNLPGSFKCICPFGYTLAADGMHCEDLDECKSSSNDCRFACKNMVGSFMCICPDGYKQVGMTDDCADIDECRSIPGVCANGHCVNTRGSYRCDCLPGFQTSRTQTECLDIRTGTCFKLSSCLHSTQDYREMRKGDCCCGIGAAWGTRCEFCPQKGTTAHAELCPHGVGFDKDGRDVDECTLMQHLCSNGHCINTLGSYRCICNRGYKPDHTGIACSDANECDHVPSPCKFQCHNTEGSYMCICPEGYLAGPDGISCRDVDECKIGHHNCQDKCINTIGSYQCPCKDGFIAENNGRCSDANECISEPNLCSPVGTCINIPGSFKCLCPRGYNLDPSGKFCIDTDECEGDSRCPNSCENMIGSYRCGCPDGFQQHHFWNQCVDENECSEAACGSASCENTIGSYSCSCPLGYIFDPIHHICIEMSVLSGGCRNAPCTFGCLPTGSQGFACGCPEGYQRIGQGHCLSSLPSLPFGLPAEEEEEQRNGQLHQDNLQIPPENVGEGEKVISTEGCYSCRLNSNNRQRRDLVMTHQLRRQDKKIAERMKPTSHHQPLEIKSQNWQSGLYMTLFLPVNRLHKKMDFLKIQPAFDYLKNNEYFEIVNGNEQNLFGISMRKDIAVLHINKVVKPGLYVLKILGTVKNSSIDTLPEEKPFHLTVHFISQ